MCLMKNLKSLLAVAAMATLTFGIASCGNCGTCKEKMAGITIAESDEYCDEEFDAKKEECEAEANQVAGFTCKCN